MKTLAGLATLLLLPCVLACASRALEREDPAPPAAAAEAGDGGVPADESAPVDPARLGAAELIALVFADRGVESERAYAELLRRGPAAIPSVVAALEREPPYAQQERIRSFLLPHDPRSGLLEFEVARGVALCYLLEAFRRSEDAPAFAPVLSGRAEPSPQDAAIAAYVAWGRSLDEPTAAALGASPHPLAGTGVAWYGSR